MVRLSLATSGDVHLSFVQQDPTTHLTLSSGIDVVDHALPDYTGATDVIPRTWVQTLPTKDTSVRSDITVREIPYFTTTNESGGYTAIIGE